MSELHDVLIRPIFSEKTTALQNDGNTYTFEVGESANKLQIKNAVQTLFEVEVEAVRTVIMRGKTKRFGRHFGKRSNWKKAYVRLSQGQSLNFFDA
jgi:large subunit ribosomal protein L23